MTFWAGPVGRGKSKVHGGAGAGPVLKSMEENDPGPAGKKVCFKCSTKTWSSTQEKKKKKSQRVRSTEYELFHHPHTYDK